MVSAHVSDGVRDILTAQTLSHQPQAVLDAANRYCKERFGFRLMTFMKYHPDTGELERVYSSLPDEFPVGGRKLMGPTDWGKRVLEDGRTWLGNSEQEISSTFPDSGKILQAAGEACACLPVRWSGQTLAVLSLCDRRDSYSADDLKDMSTIAQTLLPAALV